MHTIISLSNKLAKSIHGSKMKQIEKKSDKKNAALDKRISPAALKKSRVAVDEKIKSLKLVGAGFGRYHKAKGTPITHWIIRGPKSGKFLLVNKKQRAKILGKTLPVVKKVSPKKATPAPAPSSPEKKKRVHHLVKPNARLTALRAELGKVALRRKELLKHETNDEVTKQREMLEKRRHIIRKMIRKERHAILKNQAKATQA